MCCSLPATKPPCGQKETLRDPDSGKPKVAFKGLGTWRCTGCRKVCKVTVQKSAPREEKIGGETTTTLVTNIPLAPPDAVARVLVGDDMGRGTFPVPPDVVEVIQ